MCETVEKKILYVESAYQPREGRPLNRVGFKEDEFLHYLYVELRQYEYDVILESCVYVDGDEILHAYEVLRGGSSRDAENIRAAITRFDELYASHPVNWEINQEALHD